MPPEIISTLFGFGGVIIGAVIGAGASIWVTQKQLSASYTQHRLGVLQSQIAKLQDALLQLSGISPNLNEQNLTHEQILSGLTDMFQKRSQLFLTFSYLFPADFERKLVNVNWQLNEFIYKAKADQRIDEAQAKECVENMQSLDKQLPAMIRDKLRLLNEEFERITAKI
ncbi:MAG: hypothetical protein SVO96_10835 [Pseudomonadota bacterium]|nr:hypothetical protein [Pseudomonadota bacterium]